MDLSREKIFKLIETNNMAGRAADREKNMIRLKAGI